MLMVLRLFVASVLLLALTLSSCFANPPAMMSYQGKLMDTAGQPVEDGSYALGFRLYSQQTGGTPIWTQSSEVEVQGGVFNVLLGSVTGLPSAAFEGTTWIETEVGGTVLTPRIELVSSGYALQARIVETVPDNTITEVHLADGAVTASKIAISGITEPAIGPSAITSGALAASSVSSTKIGPDVQQAVISAIHAADSVFNVKDFGAAGNGTTDDTASFQAALNAAGATGGGIVLAPSGIFRIAGNLTVPSNVTLEGVWRSPPLKYGWSGWNDPAGTILLAYAGEGNEGAAPFLTLGQWNSGIKGLTIRYPNQRPDLSQPLVYPWTVSAVNAHNSSVIDCNIVNPYKCLNIDGGGRHYVRGLYGQPYYRGIVVDNCLEACRIENVHFWPFLTAWQSQYQAINDWIAVNGISFQFKRADWLYVLNTFVFGYSVGYHFDAGVNGSAHGNLMGIGADACGTAIRVDRCSEAGILITNAELVAFVQPVRVGLDVKSTVGNGVVRLNNCSFWGPSYRIANVESGNVSLTGCLFMHWTSSQYAIYATGGRVTVRGCHFLSSGNRVRLGSSVAAAVIVENQGLANSGTTQVLNYIGTRAAIANNRQ